MVLNVFKKAFIIHLKVQLPDLDFYQWHADQLNWSIKQLWGLITLVCGAVASCSLTAHSRAASSSLSHTRKVKWSSVCVCVCVCVCRAHAGQEAVGQL